ncbi:hypothetical protein [Burkholderia sp. BCC1985]|uniref:hypothetical protein n=1 Tax=unclassified Burkholderia TaxID=2613784 RepID=UPI0039EED8E5
MSIRRCQSSPGSQVLIDARWSARQADDRQTPTCHGEIRENAPKTAIRSSVVTVWHCKKLRVR